LTRKVVGVFCAFFVRRFIRAMILWAVVNPRNAPSSILALRSLLEQLLTIIKECYSRAIAQSSIHMWRVH
jgi:hypothetical protein